MSKFETKKRKIACLRVFLKKVKEKERVCVENVR
jgi:hypothetical protein